MKKLICFFLLIFGIQSTKAQIIEWTKLFDIHSLNARGGFSKNTIKDSNNNLITAVVESDILKIYQFDSQGNGIATLNTNQECGSLTPIVKTYADSYALVFNSTPAENFPTFKLLSFNANLEITREIQLEFPEFDSFIFGSLFTNDGGVYLTGFSSTSHLLFYLNEVNELTLKHISPINYGYRDQLKPLQNGTLMMEYGEGQNHSLRCIVPETGQLVWNRYSVSNNINIHQLNYKTTIGANQNIYFAGLERTWVAGQAVDVFKLKSIDSNTGDTIQESTYSLTDNGTPQINDFKFNPVNNHLYLSYVSSFPDENEVLLEFDHNFNLRNQVRLPYTYDNLSAGAKSSIQIRDSGDLIFVYTNYKNETENGNLYVVNLTSNLTINGTLEFNIEPKNSSESFSHILLYDSSKILITGFSPNTDPSISLEEVQYYLAMIDVDGLLNTVSPSLNPKPLLTSNLITNTLNINAEIKVKNIAFFDVLGKKLAVRSLSENAFDVSHLSHGMYFINVIGTNGKTHFSKFIKD